jgi:DNA-binding MarR family transcriptional regulator
MLSDENDEPLQGRSLRAEEWSALEVMVLRLFARSTSALGAADFSRTLGISLPHASKIAGRLKAKGLVSERRWRQFRSLRLTPDGQRFLERELPNLTAFVDAMFRGLKPAEQVLLHELLQRVR